MTEKETNTDKEINLRLNALVGVLDFYSDRAVAHASFLVACVFGLFTLLALVQNIENLELKLFSMIPYLILCSIGDLCLDRFEFYAMIADKYRDQLEKYAKPEDIYITMEEEGVKTTLKARIEGLSEKFERDLRKKIIRRYRKPAEILIFGLPFLIVYFSTLYQLFRILF